LIEYPYDIWLSPPSLTGNEKNKILEALLSGWIAPAGPQLTEWEHTLANYLSVPKALAVQSGTAALHLALKVLGLQPGQEVICPTLTFAGGVNPVIYLGGTPVFIDCDTEDYHLSYDYLNEALIQRKGNVHSVIVAHLFGRSADIQPIADLCRKHQVYLIEDAAEAVGVRYQNQLVGTVGDIGFYSFNGNKIITSSCGGAVFSNNPYWIEQASYYANHCKNNSNPFEHSDIGYYYRMSNILAGLALGQWATLEQRIMKRRWNFEQYVYHLEDQPRIRFLPEVSETFSTHWLTTIELDNPDNAEKVRLYLKKNRIESRPVWRPLHLQKPYKKYPYFGENQSFERSYRGLCLPSGFDLTQEQIAHISNLIKQILK
jgi:dTDP-4-amino-4,6-dideoxygalactose transaminase